MLSLLRTNRDAVLERLERACARAGRSPDEVRLVAVTKTVPPDVALALARLGQRDLGESRLPALEEKAAAFETAGEEVRWHFVGHLQRNKARRVARLAAEVHGVDSVALLETLARLGDEEGARPRLWLQVALTGEATKHGLAPAELPAAVRRAGELGVRLRGLMTIAPLVEGDEPAARAAARRTFARLAELARGLPADAFDEGRPLLSMGMSGDLEEAVLEGADVVRVGTALFAGLPPRAGARGAR